MCVSPKSSQRGSFFFLLLPCGGPIPPMKLEVSGSPAPADGGVTSLSDPVAALKNTLIFILEKKNVRLSLSAFQRCRTQRRGGSLRTRILELPNTKFWKSYFKIKRNASPQPPDIKISHSRRCGPAAPSRVMEGKKNKRE